MIRNAAEVYERVDGKWDFRIKAVENGNVLCGSDQGYEHRDDALKAVSRVLNAGTVPIRFVTLDAQEG